MVQNTLYAATGTLCALSIEYYFCVAR